MKKTIKNNNDSGDIDGNVTTTPSETAWKAGNTEPAIPHVISNNKENRTARRAITTVKAEKPVLPGNQVIDMKPLRPLTRKQAAFVKHLIDNPKHSATEAAAQAYSIRSARHTAEVIAQENLRKPAIMLELAKHSGNAELVLIRAMEAEKKIYKFNPETKSNEYMGSDPDHAIRIKAADSVLDRVHGKATQRTESVSTGVTINIDLTGAQELASS